MSSDQQAITQYKRLPIRPLAVITAIGLQHLFDQERHHVSELYCRLFTVGEAGHLMPLNQRRTISSAGMAQHTGRMADGRHRFTRRNGLFDQRDGVTILGQIPQWAMTTGIENRIELIDPHVRQFVGGR